ncbi:MAG: pancreas/duodenum homeobox protein 1 [Deltaproteobacteria bacterium]|nr:pancreas/duodenum homeobox protein 1 [Deltaproteobacteria bacterium]MBW2192392.1 pancreas/duodenum homeobox protein 1 [Deltaproteobacteria bacterium]
MTTELFDDVFSSDVLKKLFPEDRSDQFFDALYGDSSDGAYDIHLKFKTHDKDRLVFELNLNQRPGKCLTCSLTYGLPAVFARHPIVDINGMVREIEKMLDGRAKCRDWQLGATREVSGTRHVIPLIISLER